LYAPNPSALTVWEVASGRELLRKIVEFPLGFREGNLSPDGKKVAAVVTRNQVPEEPRLRIWDVADGQEQLDLLTDEIGLRGTAFFLSRTECSGRIRHGFQQQGPCRYVTPQRKAACILAGQAGDRQAHAVSPDGSRMAIVS
jgi:hypothetical protein